MKAASISEIKSGLKTKSPAELTELCLRLGRFKKDNKELLTFLLFEADDLENYITSVKEEMDDLFSEINTSSAFFVKKSLRKILRFTNKHTKYTGSKEAEIALLLHFCTSYNGLKLPTYKANALLNIYNSQVKKLEAAIAGMHEDLQHDYLRELDRLRG
jgi:hypothetical protein